ncbi:phosphoglucosamine mutase [Candidatus Oleimmundimicrobium sp.]|uniref:phosphoglucosamine mutase n=1 Tax=Candidatus Oleimmundimicrobium sp. TaxID=3060597 RepID=UPI00271E6971|nr:phosphoglucosamine mutase [Candidatus Oleimmundimicrobium sp.]MDO8886025.1 phosphoglucosamine mutase [Candidatus Oleimmundimicrobium sp.]
MAKLFGTDGVRGIANKDLSAELAFNLGYVGASLLVPSGKKGKIVIGRDTRISGDFLESALISGVCSAGVDVLRAGIIPTPAISYLTKDYSADGGIVISASHNPAEYNGIKFFGPSGFKISDELEDEIEMKLDLDESAERPTGGDVGVVKEAADAKERYIEHAVGTIYGELNGFRVVIDCANGASYKVSPRILRELGVNVLPLNTEPNGLNINEMCGSTYPENIQEITRSHDVDLGLAHDGDADRVIAVDEKGNLVDGDFIMAICAVYLKEIGQLPKNTVVTTVMTNLGFDLAMRAKGINVIKTDVGDKYVLREMLRCGAVLGGEQSGHIIFLKHNPTGDGIITALQLMNVIRDSGKKLSELTSIMTRLPQVLINVEVVDKDRLKGNINIWKTVEEAEKKLGEKGRILVRPSGTESLIRVMVESDTKKKANIIAEEVADTVKKELS